MIQAPTDEIPHDPRGTMKTGRGLLGDTHQHILFVGIHLTAFKDLVEECAVAVDVDRRGVPGHLLEHEFGRHITQGPDVCGALDLAQAFLAIGGVCAHQDLADPKIRYLDTAVMEKEIARLDVTMDHVRRLPVVEIAQAPCDIEGHAHPRV